MQNCKTLWQPFMGELAMSWREEREKEEREKNAIYGGLLRFCLQPRAAHAPRSDQNVHLCWWGDLAYRVRPPLGPHWHEQKSSVSFVWGGGGVIWNIFWSTFLSFQAISSTFRFLKTKKLSKRKECSPIFLLLVGIIIFLWIFCNSTITLSMRFSKKLERREK